MVRVFLGVFELFVAIYSIYFSRRDDAIVVVAAGSACPVRSTLNKGFRVLREWDYLTSDRRNGKQLLKAVDGQPSFFPSFIRSFLIPFRGGMYLREPAFVGDTAEHANIALRIRGVSSSFLFVDFTFVFD